MGAAVTGLESLGLGACASAPSTEAGAKKGFPRKFDSESFVACHHIRDGHQFPSPPVNETCEVVVVGGGPSGMAAAYRLKGRDVILLEKEPRFGGNCILDEWQGVRMSTGGAFYTESEDELVAFFKEIGAVGMPIQGADSLVIAGEPVVDIFGEGAKRLPFSQKVRDDFRRSREELIRRYKKKGSQKALDGLSFAEILKPYAPEVTKFFDRFGPSNWGGDTRNTSAYIGAEALTWAGGNEDPRWTFPGGIAGAAVQLEKVLRPTLGSKMRSGCAVYRVETEGKGAQAKAVVRYLEVDGTPKAIRANAVIMASPKLITKRVVAGLSNARAAEMRATRYAPYPVFNVCLNEPGPEPAYDNWFLDAPFTDFIPADWVVHAGKGPKSRKTALTVYHPLPEGRRAELLTEEGVLGLVDGVADGLERHFPGTIRKISEVRVFRRGHPMFISTPGRIRLAERAARPLGPVLFANTDCGSLSTFAAAHESAELAAGQALKRLGAKPA